MSHEPWQSYYNKKYGYTHIFDIKSLLDFFGRQTLPELFYKGVKCINNIYWLKIYDQIGHQYTFHDLPLPNDFILTKFTIEMKQSLVKEFIIPVNVNCVFDWLVYLNHSEFMSLNNENPQPIVTFTKSNTYEKHISEFEKRLFDL